MKRLAVGPMVFGGARIQHPWGFGDWIATLSFALVVETYEAGHDD
jgi:hypothetical protein